MPEYVLSGNRVQRVPFNTSCYPCYGVPAWMLSAPRVWAENIDMARVDFVFQTERRLLLADIARIAQRTGVDAQ